jgi:hypothetical protein
MSAKKSATKPTDLPKGLSKVSAANKGAIAPWAVAGLPSAAPQTRAMAATPADEMLLVCLQDPFDAVGSSSLITHVSAVASDGFSNHLWRLESVLEMNPPRFFESWATRGSFTLDLKVNGSVSAMAGTWGDHEQTSSGSGSCKVMVMRDLANKIQFSLASGARHATEKMMPKPETKRQLNADLGFEVNGAMGLTAGAVAVISQKNWSRLIAGSAAASKGLAFDGKWRANLEDGDCDAVAQGSWAFAVMSRAAYSALCLNHGWPEHVD